MFKNFIEFVRQTYHQPEAFVPLHEPRFRGNEKKYLEDCIDSTFVSSVGKYVNLFEEKIAAFTGAKYAIAAVNGTAALHTALLVAGVNSNDEVITQPLTFIATANAIAYTGAKPIFVDVDRKTLGLSPEKLLQWIDENAEIREINNVVRLVNITTGRIISAVVPMHTFGHPCKIDEINAICERYHLKLIEDAAESLGSYYKGRHTGTFGDVGVFSFNGNKTITTGGGGMIVTNDESVAKLAKHLTTQAKVSHPWEYVHDHIGYNYRLTNLAAALGVAQVEQLDDMILSKRKLAANYAAFWESNNMPGDFFLEPENASSNYWLNAVLLPDKETRDMFLEYTNDRGIMTRPAWELMNRLKMYRDSQTGDLSNAEFLVERLANIPSSVI